MVHNSSLEYVAALCLVATSSLENTVAIGGRSNLDHTVNRISMYINYIDATLLQKDINIFFKKLSCISSMESLTRKATDKSPPILKKQDTCTTQQNNLGYTNQCYIIHTWAISITDLRTKSPGDRILYRSSCWVPPGISQIALGDMAPTRTRRMEKSATSC